MFVLCLGFLLPFLSYLGISSYFGYRPNCSTYDSASINLIKNVKMVEKKIYRISFDVYANVICHKCKNIEQPFPNSGDAEELLKERDFLAVVDIAVCHPRHSN